MKYRSDVDGLRAVAVGAVVLFHFGFTRWFGGGYVGVDIFFVISGYLISKILLAEVEDGSYSIVDFYDRRVRRIFPALFVVYATTLTSSFVLDFNDQFREASWSAIASTFFVSNLWFLKSASYFDDSLQSNPLLHTWSLSVEEQFYIVFPLLLLALRRVGPKQTRLALLGLFTASLAAAVWMVRQNPSSAFYAMPYRAWELLVGSLLAANAIPALRQRWAAEVCGFAGLAALAFAISRYSKATLFPGESALIPCLATAAIIHAGGIHQTIAQRLLSAPPIRFVGLISYSLYLWHWPIHVFVTENLPPLGIVGKATLVGLTGLIATASWRWVERPFRKARVESDKANTLKAGGWAMAACALLSVGAVWANDVWRPTTPEVARLLNFEHYDADGAMSVGKCFLTSRFNSFSEFDQASCLSRDPLHPNVLIVGDSHAAHWVRGYQQSHPAIHFLQATASGCKPSQPTVGEQRCTDLMAHVLNLYIPGNPPDAVILSARWRKEDVEAAIRQATAIAQVVPSVIVSGPAPEYEQPLPKLLAKAKSRNAEAIAFSHTFEREEPRQADLAFKQAHWPDRVRYVSVIDRMCHPNCEVITARGIPVQFDYGHFTTEGAAEIAADTGLLLEKRAR